MVKLFTPVIYVILHSTQQIRLRGIDLAIFLIGHV